MNILNASENLDYNTSDYFTIEGYGPVVLGWKDENILSMISLSGSDVSTSEPYKRVIKKWKDFKFEIDYYHMFSTGRSTFQFNSYITKGDTITFSNGNETKSFVKSKVEISYDFSMFNIREIEAVLDSTGKEGTKGRVLVSSSSWELTPTKKFDFTKFVSSGV